MFGPQWGITTTVINQDGSSFTRNGRANGPIQKWNFKMGGQILVCAAATTAYIVASALGFGKLFTGLLVEPYQTENVVNGLGYLLLAFLSLWVGNRFIDRLCYVAADYRRNVGGQNWQRQPHKQNQPRHPDGGGQKHHHKHRPYHQGQHGHQGQNVQ
jgi:ABC-type nickel/cobalt efflux system permease component RcnA